MAHAHACSLGLSATLLGLLLLLGPSTAAGQCPVGSFVVSGTVIDAQGAPLAGFDLDILDGGGNPFPLSGDFTDANGAFSLTICQIIPDGFYDVVVRPPSTTNFLQTVYPSQFIAQGAVIGPLVVDLGVRLLGVVVNDAGLPVSQADLQFSDPVSGAITQMANETTDLTGSFDILVPPGSWDVSIRELPGDTVPAGPYVPTELGVLVLNADLDVGTRTLRRGYTVTGTILGPTGLPVSGVDIDARDPATGVELPLSGDTTGTSGTFSVLVAEGTWELEIEPPTGSGLAGTIMVFAVNPPGPIALGSIALTQGVLVSGVTSSGTAAVPNVDLDFIISATRAEVPTPDDNANGSGAFGVLVAPDTYDIQFRPPFSSGRAPVELTAVTITGPTNLGTVVLPPGVDLTGSVTLGGAPLPGARVTLSQGGLGVLVFGNTTDLLGQYALRQVAGVYDVTVTPPIGLPAASVTVPAVDLTTSAVVDVDLTPSGPTPPPPVDGLVCTVSGDESQLEWTLGASDYDEILILRDATLVGALAANAVSFSESSLPPGPHEYLVRANRSGLASIDRDCTIVVGPADLPFVRGETNDDGMVNIADAIVILGVLFGGSVPVPSCVDKLDVNDDGAANIADAVYLLGFLFTGGNPPPLPYPLAGPDPTPDALDCL